jgi:hypothetical protein
MGRRKKPYHVTKYEETQAQLENQQAMTLAQENLDKLNKPRKLPARSFILDSERGICHKCYLSLEKGDRVRYNLDGELHHTRHLAKEVNYEICNSCFLTKPCLCEE